VVGLCHTVAWQSRGFVALAQSIDPMAGKVALGVGSPMADQMTGPRCAVVDVWVLVPTVARILFPLLVSAVARAVGCPDGCPGGDPAGKAPRRAEEEPEKGPKRG
jgi:hypothetical protein